MTDEIMEFIRSTVESLGIPNVVIGDLPSQLTNCVAVRPVDGYQGVFYFGMKSSDEPLIEVVIRNEDYSLGQTQYMFIQEALNMLRNDTIGLDSMILTGSPGYLGSDESGYNEWHMIFHATIF